MRAYWTAKGVGWDNLPRRLLQAWRIHSGLLGRRLAPGRFSRQAFERSCAEGSARQRDLWRQRRQRFLLIPSAESMRRTCDDATFRTAVLEVCKKALAGEYLFFDHWYGRLGWPPRFSLDPVHGIEWPVGPHWMRSVRSGPPRDDIKLVWEASRFTLAYHFARAYRRSGQERWAEAFWSMLDAWIEQNPPEQSVAWGCGQEMTFRLMAMIFAAVVTLDSPAATDPRLASATRLAWQIGRHISVNINYARSQKNNHAISEAVGLWTIGTLFPELREASRWQADGGRILAAEVRRQVYDDGSFVQHSLNYHRVMMDDLLWALALSGRAEAPLPPQVQHRFARATGWLEQMIDPASGRVPNYGSNDGANVLPLSCCDYLDYRPNVQAARLLLDGGRPFEAGPWDEKALWLIGESALTGSTKPLARPAATAFADGGYYILRGRDSWGMIRCHTYRDRPAQADMLHLDLWYRGLNVLRDTGSYSYNCPEPWKHYFHSTAAHNTIEIDGQDQMIKGPAFLWFRWTRSRLLRFEAPVEGTTDGFEGQHFGYAGLPGGGVIHLRRVRRTDDQWEIRDLLQGGGRHQAVVRWHLAPLDWQPGANRLQASYRGGRIHLRWDFPEGWSAALESGRNDRSPEGWESLYYGRKSPIPTLSFRGQAQPDSEITLYVQCESSVQTG